MTPTPLAVLFATPLAALATLAGAASVPVIIHLLNRRQHRVVDWAAMRFLLAAMRKNVRRLRVEQFLLLAVRTLMLLLLIAAMCSVLPWAEAVWQRLLPGGAAGEKLITGRTHKVIVIDGSLSMTVAAEDGTCFDRAKSLAEKLARTSAAGDGFSLILLAAPSQAVVAGPADDSAKVAGEIEALRCPHGNADLGGGLQLVEQLIRKAPGKYARREVYFFTDLQRSTWPVGTRGGWTETWGRLQSQAQTFVLDVGRPDVDNLAVTGLALADPLAVTGTGASLTATVQNFGAKERAGLRVDLLVASAPAGGEGRLDRPQVVRQERVDVPAGGSAAVTFPYEFRAAGEYLFQVRVESDALTADDVRSLTVTARDTWPVLVVDGKPAAERYERAASWLADALFPFAESVRHPAYPARPKVVDTARFADPGAVDLATYDCVFLCDVPRLTEREVERLETHLRRGGGLVIGLGPNVDLESYNRLLYRDGKGLLPAKLVGLARAPADAFFLPFADEDAYRRPPLDAFAGDDERAGLMAARFKQYVRVEIPPGSAARRVLAFAPVFGDRPRESEPALASPDALMVEGPRHRGRVVLLASTLNTDWTSWPIAPSFPPFVQQLFRFAILQPARRTLTVGEPLEELLPSKVAATDATVQTPDGRTMTVPLRAEPDATQLRFADTDLSGLYRVRVGGSPGELVFAVNVPVGSAAESDLRRISPDELASLSPGEDVQVVSDLASIRRLSKHASALPDEPANSALNTATPRGPALARWALLAMFILSMSEAVLAWWFGAARAGPVAPLHEPEATPGRRAVNWLLAVAVSLPLAIVIFGGAVLAHAARTGNALGFLPAGARHRIESAFGVSPAAAGEGTRWRLDLMSYLTGDAANDLWLAGTIGVAAAAAAWWLYRRELGRRRSLPVTIPLVGLRVALIALTLGLLLPQVRLLFEREGWPDLVLLIDDSQSMSHVDDFRDADVKAKADELTSLAGRTERHRLALVKALTTRGDAAWLDALVARQARLHVYRCSSRVERLAEVDSPAGVAAAAAAVGGLKADGPSSALGSAVRTVLQEFRGSALAGIVMFTDGVTTDGDDLAQAARQASSQGVPLYIVGVGDSHEPRDLILSDLQVEDAVQVQDRLVFEALLTAKGGLRAKSISVTLSEKQGDRFKELARQEVTVDPEGKPVKVRLTHTPTSAGEREYVLEVPGQPDETDTANNRLTRRVYVAEFQRTRVLYIEGYPRYEYRFLKSLLERESAAMRSNKSVDVRVLLTDADPDYPKEDRSALDSFPATRDDLFKQYDLVVLGDVDPRDPRLGEKRLQWIADFVREKGGGLLAIAGGQFMPRAYRDTPLADVLPVELPRNDSGDDRARADQFRARLTPAGRMHPLFRFVPDEADNRSVWDGLPPLYWSAAPLKPKPAAEVLAVRGAGVGATGSAVPGSAQVGGAAPNEVEPLAVQQFAGAGRVMYFGFDETWRWRMRMNEARYNQFWLQTVKYLARNRLGRVEVRTDKQVPYRQREPIRITVRFPDDVPPPDEKTPVQVTCEIVAPNGEVETQTLRPAKIGGARALYETVLPRPSQGDYKFWLAAPLPAGARPQAAAKVLPPPGEMDRLQANRPDMERAALISRGKFYTLADAEGLPDDLPPLPRVTLNEPRPPFLVWNQPAVFVLAMTLVTAEWLLRKRQRLL
jgi:hypothetical protein